LRRHGSSVGYSPPKKIRKRKRGPTMGNGNRISKFADVPNELPSIASSMLYELTKRGVDLEEARKRVMQALVETFNSVVSGVPTKASDVKEFVVVVAYNTPSDPKIVLSHSCWIETNRATDVAKAYGIASAFAQYWGTKLIGEHVNKDDLQRAFTDFYQNIEVHIQQLREHERQEKLGNEGKADAQ
jgi:hypothetical protein